MAKKGFYYNLYISQYEGEGGGGPSFHWGCVSMTSKDAFNQDEWKSLVMAGTWIGHAIIIADTPRRARKELKALRNGFKLAAKKYPGNGLQRWAGMPKQRPQLRQKSTPRPCMPRKRRTCSAS